MWKYPLAISILLAGLVPVSRINAQPTNAEIGQQLTTDCLRAATDGLDSLTVIPDDRYPFLRHAVVRMLQADGATVFLGDSITTRVPTHSLRYVILGASARYRKSAKNQLDRTVNVELEYTLLTHERQVLADSLCKKDFSDTIERSDLDVVEDSSLAITTNRPPRKGFLRRIAEPAVVAAATAVAVYLFFNVRSDSKESQ